MTTADWIELELDNFIIDLTRSQMLEQIMVECYGWVVL